MSTDQKKRTLEALERRFAVARTELLQQQKKSQKPRSNEEYEKENNTNTNPSSSLVSPANLPATPVTPSSKSSLKPDLEENIPAYSQLTHPVHENILTENAKFQSNKGSKVDMILHDLLQHGDSAQKYMQGSRNKKLDNWILLDNYVQGRGKSTNSRIRALEAHSKRSKKHMSMKQHKKCGSLNLPQHSLKFDHVKPRHEMWKAYMFQLLKNTGKNQLAQCLLGADLHGAIIYIVDSKIASFTGVSGIMIRETAETFGLVTQEDKFHAVPKRSSIFMFQVDSWKITLQGDKLTGRNLSL
ncbi:ribonuclease MRP protein subunit POP4 [Mercurialis annua]|uniref:ribonuclease MRP protein subunit POP4 n=1 Tax=Mercurialis annua TaxID=3986 RepID=UPI00215E04F4|nr:ribonuclease MRP protein subunit POP4 [Mercurialis annua]XP_050227574.1 ribonuclease MRP protein subunit POP4 [Mercurialis annua]XP_050227575.1 ribonuclease MRP protein subunit POP4 [Mercurialis annua]XP_050227577.1 ribonuclease MRP protein subunit POP4 [Mercurialis annua]